MTGRFLFQALVVLGISSCAADDILPEKGNGAGSGVVPSYENAEVDTGESSDQLAEKAPSKMESSTANKEASNALTSADSPPDAAVDKNELEKVVNDFEKGLHSLKLNSYRCTFEIKDKTFRDACVIIGDLEYSQCMIDFREQIKLMTCEKKLMGFQEALDYIFKS